MNDQDDLIYCPMCEIEHENNSMCQAPDADSAQIHYEDIRG